MRAGNRIFREQRRISGCRFSSAEERNDLGKRVSVRKLETGEPVEKLSSHVVYAPLGNLAVRPNESLSLYTNP